MKIYYQGRIDKHRCIGTPDQPCPFKYWIWHGSPRCKWCIPEYNRWMRKNRPAKKGPRAKKKKKPLPDWATALLRSKK
jgi:hypothetical protein